MSRRVVGANLALVTGALTSIGCWGSQTEAPERVARRAGQAMPATIALDEPVSRMPADSLAAGADATKGLLVELFTSQGCSSCPPADELLREMGTATHHFKDFDRPIIPLAFHVDYWNYLGWSDPASSSNWTNRQNAYSAQISPGRIYTPQLIIHGRDHEVGSQWREVTETLRRVSAAATVPAQIQVEMQRQNNVIELRAAVTLSAAIDAGTLEGWIAIFENGVMTRIPRGENAGRLLRNDYIVRHMERIVVIQSGQTNVSGQLSIDIDNHWVGDHLGAVVFLQDPNTLHIHGVVAISPPSNQVD